ncbi:MAG: TetR/AcrR family transcriptional regulator [Anaerolineae bacterium]|nr:TetR/AcrR family transcriptional regulator [Anaerolineae bacterium]
MARKPTRHEQRKAATHQSLIDAARAIIVEKGYNNVEILDITERADVSKATFYKHFPNKEECVRQLMHQGFDALVDELLGGEQLPPFNQEWVVFSLGRVLRWADDNREFLLIMVGGAASSRLNVFGRNYMSRITERMIVQRLENREIPPRYPARVQAQVITGVLIQMLGWWLENDTGYSAEYMARMLADILQNGLGTLVGSEHRAS